MCNVIQVIIILYCNVYNFDYIVIVIILYGQKKAF